MISVKRSDEKLLGPDLINEMQNSRPSQVIIFTQKMCNLLKRMKNQLYNVQFLIYLTI